MIRNFKNVYKRLTGHGKEVKADSLAHGANKKVETLGATFEAQKNAIKKLGLESEAEAKLLEGIAESSAEAYKNIGARAAEDIIGGGGIRGVIRRNPVKSGAAALGGAAYASHLVGKAGTPVMSDYAAPEEHAAQAAMQDIMMQAPMPQIQAANANHEGMMLAQQHAVNR